MNKHVNYKTEGVCAKEISFDIIDGAIMNVKFSGGCKGNSAGIERLVEGMDAEDVILKLKGIDCHGGSSCPNEFVKAIEECLKEQ
ncbi:TIGR03905 family TSCPD domain-containing protein [Clostridium hydrogenum]|uniref:TIGR03905 family TSCPD domain-containing protein n=1 Tax=Clostridium hydrogenum TaxID=2855764 RepID=UPI001F223F6F|nr:TIGR03905 family TSCPD domain-containing protein [Clostridium hydrogenum]